jgi:hypothetical protein
MLQFLINDHLPGYNLPSPRKTMMYDWEHMSIKDGVVSFTHRGDISFTAQPIALRCLGRLYTSLRVLLETGEEYSFTVFRLIEPLGQLPHSQIHLYLH